MPARISIECTHCGAKLNLADSSKLGKKIKCPKCSEVFVAASDDDLGDDDIEAVDDDNDQDDDEPALPRGKKGAAASGGAKKGAVVKGGKGKKGKGKKSGSNLGLIIGGGVGAVVLLGGLVGVLFATGAFGAAKVDPNQIQVNPTPGTGVFSSLLKEQAAATIPPRSPIPDVAKWLPADTELVVHVRVADIMEAPLVKDLLKSMQMEGKGDEFLAEAGLKLTDVESLTMGMAGLEKAAKQAQQAQMALMMGSAPQANPMNPPGIVVVKLKKPVTYDALLKLAMDVPVQKAQHAGKEYLEATELQSSTMSGAYLASETVLVIGDSASVKSAMEKGAVSAPVPNFGFMDWTDHFVLAMAAKDWKALQSLAPPSTGNLLADQAAAMIKDGVSGYSFSLTVKGGVESELAIGCADKAKTEAVVKTLNDGWALAKSQYPGSKNQLPPWAIPLVDFLVNNLTVKGTDRIALVTTNIPDSAQQQLAQLPAMIMTQMAMTAMLGGATGAPTTTLPPTSPGDSPSPGGEPTDAPTFAEPTNSKATSAERLPDGFELSGALSDGYDFEFDNNGKPKKSKVRKLIFNLELAFAGPGEKCVIAAVGKAKPGAGETADGTEFQLTLPKPFDSEQKKGEFDAILNFPDFGNISVGAGSYELEISADETEPLKSLSGSFCFLTGKKSKLLQLKDLRSHVGKTPTDPDFKAVGLEIKIEKRKDAFGESEVAILSVKKGYLLSEVQSIDGDGKWSFDSFPENGPTEQVQILKPGVGTLELKEGLGFQAFLYSDIKEVTVPFTFENIELPKKKE